MKARAAVVIIQNDRIALIDRYRSGKHYLVFPGGKIEAGETPALAAAREIKEELGLDVIIGQMLAEIWYEDTPQYYFLGHVTGGNFGHGIGKEMSSLPGSKKGSHLPVWVPMDDLPRLPVLPNLMAEYVVNSYHTGWLVEPIVVTDRPPDESV